jgi:cytochrome b6-f complex iron-sulfur subunit
MSKETPEKEGVSRRDFLGLASVGAAVVSFMIAIGGIFRMTKATVHYEESKTFKVGKPDEFPIGTVKVLAEKNVFIFAGNDGLHAISNVCTHLGCIVSYDSEKGFECPCHGSTFAPDGVVTKGPAPTPLPWMEVSMLPSGQLIVDNASKVDKDTRFIV